MRIANHTPTAQPLSDGSILAAGEVAEVPDDVADDAIDRGAADRVDQPHESLEPEPSGRSKTSKETP